MALGFDGRGGDLRLLVFASNGAFAAGLCAEAIEVEVDNPDEAGFHAVHG